MSRHRHHESEEFEGDLTPRAQARRNLQARRHWENSLVSVVVVCALLVVLWAITGAGYFWPGWVIGVVVVAMVLRFAKSQRGPISQRDVEEETHRIESGR